MRGRPPSTAPLDARPAAASRASCPMGEMNQNYARYLLLHRKLLLLRAEGSATEEFEDDAAHELEHLWWRLSAEEQQRFEDEEAGTPIQLDDAKYAGDA